MFNPYRPDNLERLWFASNPRANANLLLLESAVLSTLAYPAAILALDKTGFGFGPVSSALPLPIAGRLWVVVGTPTLTNLPDANDADWAIDFTSTPRALWGPLLAGTWPTLPITAGSTSVATVWYGMGVPSNTLGRERDLFIDESTGNWFGPRQPAGWPVAGFRPSSGALIGTVGLPNPNVGQDGMFAVDAVNGQMYGPKTNGSWGTPYAMAPVPTGLVTGQATDPRLADGQIGDFWINTQSKTLFGPKSSTGWPVGMLLGSSAGAFLSGSGAPAPSVGSAGDVYLDTLNIVLYTAKPTDTTWGTAIQLQSPYVVAIRPTVGKPLDSQFRDGDQALDLSTGLVYTKTLGAWDNGVQLITAPTGLVHGTSGLPAGTVGANGDFAWDSQANRWYGPKVSGVWPTSVYGTYEVPTGLRTIIAGSCGGNAVLFALMQALAANGQLINNTTA